MANTGKKIVLELKEVASPGGAIVDHHPNNGLDGTPFISPYEDLTACPVTSDTACPTTILTDMSPNLPSGTINFEFSLSNSTINNPAIAKVMVTLSQSGLIQATVEFPAPFASNYFTGSFSGYTGVTSLGVRFISSTETVLNACDSIVTKTIP
jgi:hypothetical protein